MITKKRSGRSRTNFSSKKVIDKIIKDAVAEDVGPGDVTTNSIFVRRKKLTANIYSKEDGIAAGMIYAKSVFKYLDKRTIWKSFVKEGARIKAGTKIATVEGSYRALLTGERTALNILQRISGIATRTSGFVDCLKGTNAKVLDTRKTAPGLRQMDKYGVKAGGGKNHRIGLYDMALIKDNHIKAAGSIASAVEQVRSKKSGRMKIEVETSNLQEVGEALAAGVEIIMLDNMNVEMMKKAVTLINGRAKVEASGNITMKNIRKVAGTGVDYISVGELTHSVKALDINMKIEF